MLLFNQMETKEKIKASTIRVLILDDDDDDSFIIKELVEEHMKHEEPEVIIANNLDAALELCYKEEFDICLLDYRLGKRDGIRVLHSFREAGFIFPIIFLTGQGDENVAVHAMKSGAADYFPKGDLVATEFVKSIRAAVRTHRSMQSIEDFLV